MEYSGIGDEAGPAIEQQIEAHAALGWAHIELRTVEGRPLAELEPRAFDRVAREVAGAGLAVRCIASQIGSWARPVDSPFDLDVRELRVLAGRAGALGARYVRIMSTPGAGRAEALERIGSLAALAELEGLVLLHENCAGWAGTSAERSVELVEAVASPALRLLFDTGNGVADGYEALPFLRRVLPYVAHVHIKDGAEGSFTFPGEGDCELAACLRLLVEAGYDGLWSIEPHLTFDPRRPAAGASVQAPANFVAQSHKVTFVEYGRRLERLVAEQVLAAEVAR